ncbi:MAG: metallophosphatase [Bacteroidota bacterium]|nr:metallophosphatase [Bacteroidota bacterium]
MRSRRDFIKKAGLGALSLGFIPNEIFAENDLIKLTILHTNDMHSHIQPFTSGSNKGLGGMAERTTLIKKIREENEHVLLLDAGDIFQGTPYFNMYGGELEFKLMSEMKYDAATIGNHDFDNGLNGLKAQLPNANFPFLCANYDFSDSVLGGQFKPFKLFKKGGLKIGVFGIGIELEGLVPRSLYGSTIYHDPITKSNHYANHLKNELGCNLVICISHLGFKYKSSKIDDINLAEKTKNIDLIIGGHTHTFLNKPIVKNNLQEKQVLIAQVGWAGIKIGKIDYLFSRKNVIENIFGGSFSVKNG